MRFAPATNVGENCIGAKGVVLCDIAKGWKVNNAQKGFTLIEIAIVLVIVGFLMVGVAKAQELIQGSRVRALIAQQSDIRTAFFAFHDRYRALPGGGSLSNLMRAFVRAQETSTHPRTRCADGG